MSNEPHIVAARRRAKMLSRQSGQSYQHHLNEVAREAGRPDWKAFLADPAPLPEDEPIISTPEIHHVQTDASIDTEAAHQPKWRRWLVRRTIIVTAALTLLVGLVAAAAWQQIVTSNIAGDMTIDRMAHRSTDFIQRNVPIARDVRIGDMHRVDMVMVDSRAQMASWTYNVLRFLGYDSRVIFSGARTPEMRQTVRDNPILMIRMHVNCRTRKWRIAGIVAATSYDGPPVRVEYGVHRPRIAWLDMTKSNRHAICDAPEDTVPRYDQDVTPAQYALQTRPAGDPAARSDREDALWYGIDALHPRYIPEKSEDAGGIWSRITAMFGSGRPSSTPDDWREVQVPAGWTRVTQQNGFSPPISDPTGPQLEFTLATRSDEAGRAAAEVVARDIVRRFDLNASSGLLTTPGGYVVMRVRFSATPRADRPLSSTLRYVELTQNGDGIRLKVYLRGRYVRDLRAWRASLEA